MIAALNLGLKKEKTNTTSSSRMATQILWHPQNSKALLRPSPCRNISAGSTGPFCDSVDISLYTPFVKNEQKLPRTLKRYVETQVGFSVSEDFVPGCLFESWCNHYDSDCNNGESFDCYGLSLFTLEQMSQVCEEIKTT